jgi:hypothetical protein
MKRFAYQFTMAIDSHPDAPRLILAPAPLQGAGAMVGRLAECCEIALARLLSQGHAACYLVVHLLHLHSSYTELPEPTPHTVEGTLTS